MIIGGDTAWYTSSVKLRLVRLIFDLCLLLHNVKSYIMSNSKYYYDRIIIRKKREILIELKFDHNSIITVNTTENCSLLLLLYYLQVVKPLCYFF